jgi:hypothetical protein
MCVWSTGGMILTEETEILEGKSIPVPLSSPQQ